MIEPSRNASNPFSTCYIQPGAIPYRFQQTSLAELGERLLAARRCQLTGPHGSGKSTLMRSLAAWWTRHAGPVRIHRIAPNGRIGEQRDIPSEIGEQSPLWCFDGWDACQRWRRWRHTWSWSRRGVHVLLTNHQRRAGWEQLAACRPTLSTMLEVVEHLQQDVLPDQRVSTRDVADAFRRHDGNARETLFALYDVFEDRKGALTEARRHGE